MRENLPLHALDPLNNNIVSLEDALVPYKESEPGPPIPQIPDFDLMKIISDVQQDEQGDQEILLAATQYEKGQNSATQRRHHHQGKLHSVPHNSKF